METPIITLQATLIEAPTRSSTVAVFDFFGFTTEACWNLRELELTYTNHSDKSQEYEAEWRVSEDGGWLKASWRTIGDKTFCSVIYKYSEDDMEQVFGRGDYSCSQHWDSLLTWEGSSNINREPNPDIPKLDDILKLNPDISSS